MKGSINMKIIIDGCEVEIKAKSAGKNQYNETDTMFVLNTLTMLAYEASRGYDNVGCNHLANDARNLANTIYDLLDKNGYYK